MHIRQPPRHIRHIPHPAREGEDIGAQRIIIGREKAFARLGNRLAIGEEHRGIHPIGAGAAHQANHMGGKLNRACHMAHYA
jgi:hypothetical protein